MIRIPTIPAAAALLYGALVALANPALSEGLDEAGRAELEAMRSGDMAKLVFHDQPYPPIEESWQDQYGNAISMADYAGKVVVVNYWATWCPPCLAEMPSLDRLAGRMKDEGVAVVPISTDRGKPDRIVEFYEEIDVQHLGVHHDRNRDVVRKAAVLGLPVTTLIDPHGVEVARLVGDADWNSDEAVAILRRLVALTADGDLQDARAGVTPKG